MQLTGYESVAARVVTVLLILHGLLVSSVSIDRLMLLFQHFSSLIFSLLALCNYAGLGLLAFYEPAS